MEQVIRYEALDGTLFRTAAEAEKRDALYRAVEDAMAPLGAEHRFDRSGGEEFRQHDPAACIKARDAITQVIIAARPGWQTPEWPASWHCLSAVDFGRMISRGMPNFVRHQWARLCCIDDQGREWDQPYFALNPNPNAVEVKP